MYCDVILDIPSPSLVVSFTTLPKKKVKKKIPGPPVTLMKNNSVSLGLSGKIIR
jgi:hypothetical protein